MKTEKTDSRQYHSSKNKNSLTSSLRLCSCLITILFSTAWLPITLAAGTALSEQFDPLNILAAQSETLYPLTTQPDIMSYPQPLNYEPQPMSLTDETQTDLSSDPEIQKLAQQNLLISKSPTSNLQRRLWNTRITSPKSQKNNTDKNELKQILEKVQAFEVKPQYETSVPALSLKTTSQSKPVQTPSATIPAEKPEQYDSSPTVLQDDASPPSKPVTDETLKILENTLQQCEHLENAFELAEVLFRSGHHKKAALHYRKALEHIKPDDIHSVQNTAWILFQLGNCMREDDPSTAIEMYRKLIVKYTDSQWVDLAEAYCKLTQWYQENKPETLLKK